MLVVSKVADLHASQKLQQRLSETNMNKRIMHIPCPKMMQKCALQTPAPSDLALSASVMLLTCDPGLFTMLPLSERWSQESHMEAETDRAESHHDVSE